MQSTTELSGGAVAAAGTKQQTAVGVRDSAELYAADIERYNQHQSDHELTLTLCQESARIVEFLETRVGLSFGLQSRAPVEGHSVHRVHLLTEGGAELQRGMREAVLAHPGIWIADRTPLQRLIVRDRAVMGVAAGARGGALVSITCRKVVLASGGFGANSAMTAAHMPEVGNMTYEGGQSVTGDGISQAVDLGAAVAHMGSYLAHAHTWPTRLHGRRTNLAQVISMRGGIIVNRMGKRFAAEDVSSPRFVASVLTQPDAMALEIFDQRIADTILGRDSVNISLANGTIQSADTLPDLAKRFAIDALAVQGEVDRYNHAVAEGRDWLGRTVFGEPLRPPFYGALIAVGFSTTQGGLKVNSKAEVVTPDGEPIPNLYAAGDTAAGLSGDRGSAGYLPGNGLLNALGLGAIAGRNSAKTAETIGPVALHLP